MDLVEQVHPFHGCLTKTRGGDLPLSAPHRDVATNGQNPSGPLYLETSQIQPSPCATLGTRVHSRPEIAECPCSR